MLVPYLGLSAYKPPSGILLQQPKRSKIKSYNVLNVNVYEYGNIGIAYFLDSNVSMEVELEKLTTAFNICVHNFSTDPIWPILTWCILSKEVLKRYNLHVYKFNTILKQIRHFEIIRND